MVTEEKSKVLQYGMTPNYGGVEAFIMNIYRNIDRQKIQFDFMVKSEENVSYKSEIQSLGGRILPLDHFQRKTNFFKHYKVLFEYFRKNKNVKAVHINKANIRDIDVLIMAWLFRVPIRIIHSHTGTKEMKLKGLEKINSILLSIFANKFMACSVDAGTYMFNNRKFQVINNAIDIEKYKYNYPIRKKLRSDLNLEDNFVIGTVGRMSNEKNSLFILEIFKEILKDNPKSMLLYVGNGPLSKEIFERIQQYNIEDRVLLLGERKDIPELLQVMDVFLFPSKYEGFGIALLEAQASGLQCVASKGVIPGDVNVSGEVHFVSLEATTQKWTEAVLEKKAMARYDASQTIRDKGFDIKTMAKEIEDIYMSL